MDIQHQIADSLSQGIIDGKAYAKLIRDEISAEISNLNIIPNLTTILVGDDPASHVYVSFKEKACREVGMKNSVIKLPSSTTMDTLLETIHDLNDNTAINGILLQLPLPSHLDDARAVENISPIKDVDGLHYVNIGKLHAGYDGFIPCTPHGIMQVLKRSNISVEGKHAVVIGRSNLVGKPIARLLERANATVTQCHSRTKNLEEITRRAEILIVAIGKPNFITGNMVKKDAIVIDVGINRVDDKLVGDVEFGSVKPVSKLITPVPGGVGPLTVAMLLWNTLLACKNQNI